MYIRAVSDEATQATPVCWGNYGGTCPTGQTWSNVQIYSTGSAFVAVDASANSAFCWGDSSYGGTCPSGRTWSNVQIYSTSKAFVAVDASANSAFCWGSSVS